MSGVGSGSAADGAAGAVPSSAAGVAWVAGASGAWGGAIARELLRRGYDVVALGRTAPPWLAAEAAAAGRRSGWVALDLASPPAGADLVGRAPEGLQGVPDVLVDAAFSTEGDPAALVAADYVAKTELIGAVAASMRARGSGRIGVLVGQNGRLGLAGLGDLSAPQGALWTWAEALAEELRTATPDVRLTVVVPPRTASPTQRVVAERSGRTAKLHPPDARPVVGGILAGRRRAGRRPILAGLALIVR